MVILSLIFTISFTNASSYMAILSNKNMQLGNKEDPYERPQIYINDITDDNVINSVEVYNPIDVNGYITGSVKNGDIINISVDNQIFSTIVKSGKTFSVNIDGYLFDYDYNNTIEAELTFKNENSDLDFVSTNKSYTLNTYVITSIDDIYGYAIAGEEAIFEIKLSQESGVDLVYQIEDTFKYEETPPATGQRQATADDIGLKRAYYFDDEGNEVKVDIDENGLFTFKSNIKKMYVNVETKLTPDAKKYTVTLYKIEGQSKTLIKNSTTAIL